jgi:RNA polymerase sigma-70 factor (ECF subfamily)
MGRVVPDHISSAEPVHPSRFSHRRPPRPILSGEASEPDVQDRDARAQTEDPPAGPPTAMNERHLVARLKAGDDGAFADLVAAHAPRMFAVAQRICPSDAEDVLQEAFLSASRNIGTFDGRSLLGTWLHRITVNAALMNRRRKARRPEVPIDTLMPRFRNGFFDSMPAELPAPVTQAGGLDIEQREVLWAAIDRLPQEFRTVLVLRDLEGVESAAVAVSLGISDSLVRQRLHRARMALVKLLELSEFDGAARS